MFKCLHACLPVVQWRAKLLSGAVAKYDNDFNCRQQHSEKLLI